MDIKYLIAVDSLLASSDYSELNKEEMHLISFNVRYSSELIQASTICMWLLLRLLNLTECLGGINEPPPNILFINAYNRTLASFVDKQMPKCLCFDCSYTSSSKDVIIISLELGLWENGCCLYPNR